MFCSCFNYISIGRLTPLEVSCEHPLLGDELRLNLRENDFMVHQANFPLLLGCTHHAGGMWEATRSVGMHVVEYEHERGHEHEPTTIQNTRRHTSDQRTKRESVVGPNTASC